MQCMNVEYALIAIFMVLLLIGAAVILTWDATHAVPEKYCAQDSDCLCGRHVATDNCFYGNKLYVDPSDQCPDFCTGIHGSFTLQCIRNECVQAFSSDK